MAHDVRSTRAALEAGTLTPDDALPALVELARGASTRGQRSLACGLLGDLAGRAFGARWEVAERAAWALLELAGIVDSTDERRELLLAMARGFRNVWLLPYVHRRMSDPDPAIVAAAATAAGGLGFPALEEAVVELITPDAPLELRLAAVAALGRMGSVGAADRLRPLVQGDPREAAAALTALTEIRSPVALADAAALLATDPEPEIVVAGVRYLAELGAMEVLSPLRRLARDDDALLRTAASFASRAFKAERGRDAGERFLVALTEKDRAVRASLARRLRTIATAEILEHADVLLSEDAEGVVQVLAEIREPDVTRYLLGLVERADLSEIVRARAALAIEANLPWEREALGKIAGDAGQPETVRAAAAQAMGAFADLEEMFRRIGDLAGSPAASLRGAFLWALQLAARPSKLEGALRKRTTDAVRALLGDGDALVRRRAAYVAGNLALVELAPALIASARTSPDPEQRIAVFTALGELRSVDTFAETLELARRPEKTDTDRVAVAALRTLAAIVAANPGQRLDLGPIAGRVTQHLTSKDALVREAAVRIAGLARGAVAPPTVARLGEDPSPRVRGEAFTALGRLGAREAEPALIAAFQDADPAIHERAARALVELGGRKALEQVLAYVGGEGDDDARAHVAGHLAIPPGEAGHFLPLLDAALDRLGPADAAYEPLLGAKLELLEAKAGGNAPGDIDERITGVFPSFSHLRKLRGFEALVKSLRTAESLYHSTATIADADQSPPIVLWMKCLENYVHAWLGQKMSQVQREPASLFAYVDTVAGAWPTYQRFVGERWKDSVQMGTAKVDVPLRSLPNALRDFQEHKRKRLDSPLSVTEWARLIVFFAVDHASGPKNLFKLPVKGGDQVIRLAHRLHTLAAVRNLVTHRAAASGSTLDAFRKSYYQSFEDLAQIA